MALTQSQLSLIEKTRSVGASREAEALSDKDCVFLVATIARDLELLDHFPDLPTDFPGFFQLALSNRPNLAGVDFCNLFERLVSLEKDADSYFACLLCTKPPATPVRAHDPSDIERSRPLSLQPEAGCSELCHPIPESCSRNM